ncbi:uncharacterized protein LOC135367098 isoform X2 [Ornithodoros turicata]|uniref:uncharacterized protein LOC135367098 isoform X2 n=1 Tax=Ornithodoros turicata TaxID=34597 RepID=UPI0031397ADE
MVVSLPQPCGGLVAPKTACTIIGYATGVLALLTSVAGFLRVLVASSDSKVVPDHQGEIKVNYLIFLFPAIYCLFHLFTCVLLIWGSKIERAQLILPWIVTGVVDILLSIAGMIVMGIAATKGGQHLGLGSTSWCAAAAGICGLLFCLMIYFVLVVFAHFEDLVQKPHTNVFRRKSSTTPHLHILNGSVESVPNAHAGYDHSFKI